MNRLRPKINATHGVPGHTSRIHTSLCWVPGAREHRITAHASRHTPTLATHGHAMRHVRHFDRATSASLAYELARRHWRHCTFGIGAIARLAIGVYVRSLRLHLCHRRPSNRKTSRLMQQPQSRAVEAAPAPFHHFDPRLNVRGRHWPMRLMSGTLREREHALMNHL